MTDRLPEKRAPRAMPPQVLASVKDAMKVLQEQLSLPRLRPGERPPGGLAPKDPQAAQAAMQTLGEQFSRHCVSLTPEERRNMRVLDGEDEAFIHATLKHAQANPHLVPDTMDLHEFERQVEALKQFGELRRQLALIEEALEARMLLADGDSRAASYSVVDAMKSGPATDAPQADAGAGDDAPGSVDRSGEHPDGKPGPAG